MVKSSSSISLVILALSVAVALAVCENPIQSLTSKLVDQAEKVRTRGSITYDEVQSALDEAQKRGDLWSSQEVRANFAYRLLDEFGFAPIRGGQITTKDSNEAKSAFVEKLVEDFIIGWET